jgi:hypothetical protein
VRQPQRASKEYGDARFARCEMHRAGPEINPRLLVEHAERFVRLGVIEPDKVSFKLHELEPVLA